ncbi:hypothetical protein G6514_002707 [Epicoccum nigrum]|nr:hypothetical protein G6514_002707 [Epicoccum nigrum]
MGKVHGSLARAGKVKSQTPHLSSTLNAYTSKATSSHPLRTLKDFTTTLPEVEPQEKKKTPKGRAKKRLTYTRRFVNVTMTGGKRKMNPNPGS